MHCVRAPDPWSYALADARIAGRHEVPPLALVARVDKHGRGVAHKTHAVRGIDTVVDHIPVVRVPVEHSFAAAHTHPDLQCLAHKMEHVAQHHSAGHSYAVAQCVGLALRGDNDPGAGRIPCHVPGHHDDLGAGHTLTGPDDIQVHVECSGVLPVGVKHAQRGRFEWGDPQYGYK